MSEEDAVQGSSDNKDKHLETLPLGNPYSTEEDRQLIRHYGKCYHKTRKMKVAEKVTHLSKTLQSRLNKHF